MAFSLFIVRKRSIKSTSVERRNSFLGLLKEKQDSYFVNKTAHYIYIINQIATTINLLPPPPSS